MTVQSQDGELLWAPDNFGKYSVEKIEAIRDILKDLMTDLSVSVTIDGKDGSLMDSYTKEETNALLQDYMSKTDFGTMANEAIQAQTDLYLKTLQEQGKLVTSDVVGNLSNSLQEHRSVIEKLTKFCFDKTYADTLVATDLPTASSIAMRLDNLTSVQQSHQVEIDALTRDFYLEPTQRTGYKFLLKDTYTTKISELEKQLEDADSKIEALESENISLRQALEALTVRVQSLEDASSGEP